MLGGLEFALAEALDRLLRRHHAALHVADVGTVVGPVADQVHVLEAGFPRLEPVLLGIGDRQHVLVGRRHRGHEPLLLVARHRAGGLRGDRLEQGKIDALRVGPVVAFEKNHPMLSINHCQVSCLTRSRWRSGKSEGPGGGTSDRSGSTPVNMASTCGFSPVQLSLGRMQD